MADPRPFGVGYFGTGYYSRYRGSIYDVAGASSISFSAHGTAQLLYEPHGEVDLQFAAWTWGIERSRAIAGRTQIQLTAWAEGLQRLINPHARTEIHFSVWALNLELSWPLPAPCVPGGWDLAEPCEDGPWDAPEGCALGGWTDAACEPGAWTPPPGGSAGAWKPVRLQG